VALKFKPPLLDTKYLLGHLKQQILPLHFLNIKVSITHKFKGEIAYAIFDRFKFKHGVAWS